MEQEKPLELSYWAKKRMASRNLNDYHIWYCRFHCSTPRKIKEGEVWTCVLPDGRNVKVRVIETHDKFIVSDAFTYI